MERPSEEEMFDIEDLARQYYEKGHPNAKDINVEVIKETIERRPKKSRQGQ